MRPLQPHRYLALLALVTVAAISLLATPPAEAQQACQSSNATSSQATSPQIQQATLCLLNEERNGRGLAKLRLNNRLSAAARRHATDMVRSEYFSHKSLSGASFVDRIRRSGYLRSVNAWSVGENLAWGAGDHSTPRSIMRSWMKSPGHRTNILDRHFREIGIGIAPGAPAGSWDDASTYATTFGFRR